MGAGACGGVVVDDDDDDVGDGDGADCNVDADDDNGGVRDIRIFVIGCFIFFSIVRRLVAKSEG